MLAGNDILSLVCESALVSSMDGLGSLAAPGHDRELWAWIPGRRIAGSLEPAGQIIVDVAQRPVDVAAADALGAGVAGQAGCQPVHFLQQIGMARQHAHMARHPVIHEVFDIGLGLHDVHSRR